MNFTIAGGQTALLFLVISPFYRRRTPAVAN